MRTKLSLLALLCLATPVLGQDRAEFSSIVIGGPKTRSVSPQFARFERDLANQLLALAPRVRGNKLVSREVALSLARLGRLNVALRITPDKTTKTALIVMATRRSIIEGNEKLARGLITRLPKAKRDGLKLLLAQSILMNRGDKQEALAILKTIPVVPVSFTSFDISERLQGFQIGLAMAEAGDKISASKRFDLMESRLKQAELLSKRSENTDRMMAEGEINSYRGLLVVYRLNAGLERDALRMLGQNESLLYAAAGYFLENNEKAKARQILQKLPPDYAMQLISQPIYGEWDKEGQACRLPMREALFREILPKVSSDARKSSISNMALVFIGAGKTERALPLINELSAPEQRNKTLGNFRRGVVFFYRYSSGELGHLAKKLGKEELLQAQMKVRKSKGNPTSSSHEIESELEDVLSMAKLLSDRVSARNALYELEKIVHKGYPSLPSLVNPVSRELEFARNWGEIGDWKRADRWMNRVAPAEKRPGISNRLTLLLSLAAVLDEADLKQVISNVTPKEWSKLNVEQIGQFVDSMAIRALNTNLESLPSWIGNLPRADQKAFAIARWTAGIRPYESTLYELPRKRKN